MIDQPNSPSETSSKGLEFETEVARLFQGLGSTSVIKHPVIGGQRVDLVVDRPDPKGQVTRAAVECKAFTLKVGRGTVNTFASLVENLRRDGHVQTGIMVALSGFTALARRDAKRRGIVLHTLDQLRALEEFTRIRGKLAQPRPRPRIEEQKPSGKYVFVLMPFDKQFDDIYYHGIRGAVNLVGFTCERVDEIHFIGPIIEKVVEQIRRADIIVADMTSKNPNVFYELGFAHALQKKVVLVAQELEDIPFDLRHQKTIIYEGSRERLQERLVPVLKVLGGG